MPYRIQQAELASQSGFRRALQYAYYDWTREMPRSKRLILWAGHLMQGYAFYALLTRSLVWPLIWPEGIPLYASVSLLYIAGAGLKDGMLTSEFVRKTQLESDQIAARQIQQTLQPEKLENVPGYEMETYYKPYRDVGGDYFDVIELPGERTLFAVADVSGKGMPAALLAANIQALVRSNANIEADPSFLARQINKHLLRYTPTDRFATAVFIVLNRESGELTYVNAGHNAPIVFASGNTTLLEPTGVPLGLLSAAEYQSGKAVVPPGGTLLLFTDGLTDSIPGDTPQDRFSGALSHKLETSMSNLKALVDPKLNQDDVTILLVKRGSVTPGGDTA
jgi:serine phosphatase RsbU (regulator of sigma subunit)